VTAEVNVEFAWTTTDAPPQQFRVVRRDRGLCARTRRQHGADKHCHTVFHAVGPRLNQLKTIITRLALLQHQPVRQYIADLYGLA
jgi:hypothetical protein